LLTCDEANPYRSAFALVEKSSALDAIGNGEVSAFENPAIQQLKIDLPFHLVKERNARAEQHGMNVEDDFINQVGLEQALGQLAAAKDNDAFAFLVLQLLNERRGVGGDDFDILVGLLRRQFLSQRGALFLRASGVILVRSVRSEMFIARGVVRIFALLGAKCAEQFISNVIRTLRS